jgi:hypothetical protein
MYYMNNKIKAYKMNGKLILAKSVAQALEFARQKGLSGVLVVQ